MNVAIFVLLVSQAAFSQATVSQAAVSQATKDTKTPPKGPLALQSYIEQVRAKNDAYRGAKLASEGARDHSGEAGLLTSPAFFMNGTWLDDRAPRSNPNMGSGTLGTNYQIGIEQNTPFGLAGKLYYEVTYSDVAGASSLFVPRPTLYEARPVFEGRLSLWRNLLGKETRAKQDTLESQAKAVEYRETFIAKATLSEAELSYWKLAIARNLKHISWEALERSKRLRDWNSSRVRNGLGDRSELLQAEGNYRMRTLEYQAAADEERAASLQFNAQRGINSAVVEDALEPLPDSKADFYKVPARTEMREDTRAALEEAFMTRARAEEGEQRNLPTLDVVGKYSYNGLDREYSKASEQAFKNDFPNSYIGVKFSVPLDIGTLTAANGGYKKEAAASDYKYHRKLFEQERDWNDLTSRYTEVKARLALAESFEASQKEKYDYERSRHSKGRTTTFMVLQFEQEYALAQANRLKLQGEVLGLVAQMKTYGGSL